MKRVKACSNVSPEVLYGRKQYRTSGHMILKARAFNPHTDSFNSKRTKEAYIHRVLEARYWAPPNPRGGGLSVTLSPMRKRKDRDLRELARSDPSGRRPRLSGSMIGALATNRPLS